LVSVTADQVRVSVLARKRRHPTFGGQPGRQRTVPLLRLPPHPCWPPASGLLGVVIDSIGLVTFRIGKELIGGAEAAAKIF